MVKIVWGLIILYFTIKTRMIYFCVSRLSKAQNWRIFITKREKMVLVLKRNCRWCFIEAWNIIPYLLWRTCTAQPPQNNCCRWCTIDLRSRCRGISINNFFNFFWVYFLFVKISKRMCWIVPQIVLAVCLKVLDLHWWVSLELVLFRCAV